MYEIADIVNKVHCADCLEFMRHIPDKSIDLILTDPPYGFGRFKGDEKESFMKVIEKAFIEIKRILKEGSWAFVFTGTGEIKNLLNAICLDFRRLLWVYKPNDCTFPYRGWLLTSEAIALFSNGNPIALTERNPYRHDCYIHTGVGNEGVDGHPTVKPKNIILDLCLRTEGLILDPFAGSGTTLVAAKELGRRFIGIEIEQRYVDICNRRLAQEYMNLGV
jgi:site-specific DNA-methyltransferase (adenine-specific)